MKRIKFMLLAIAMLLAAPAFLTSCQEDAPEINYTMNVSVINDFTKVVEAINNGSLKNEQAIAKLTEAIDKMNADQQTKLQAIIDVLNSVNATLETKLATIEAAMKAQTLTLESKLDLLETAIKNQTIKQEEMADKLVTAIDNLKGSMEAKIEAITATINSLIASVNSGNTSAAAALAQIIQKLEELKAAIGSGGDSTPDFTNTITLDGVTMPIIDAGIDEDEFNEGNYDIVLFVSEDKGIKIMAGKEPHDGKTIDLTKKEPEHDGWYWSVECYNPELIFDTYGEPGTSYPVFMSGTLSVKSLGSEDGKPVFEIVLKNGKVKGEGEYGDGKEHTISLNFKGSMRFDDY